MKRNFIYLLWPVPAIGFRPLSFVLSHVKWTYLSAVWSGGIYLCSFPFNLIPLNQERSLTLKTFLLRNFSSLIFLFIVVSVTVSKWEEIVIWVYESHEVLINRCHGDRRQTLRVELWSARHFSLTVRGNSKLILYNNVMRTCFLRDTSLCFNHTYVFYVCFCCFSLIYWNEICLWQRVFFCSHQIKSKESSHIFHALKGLTPSKGRVFQPQQFCYLSFVFRYSTYRGHGTSLCSFIFSS